MSTTPNAKRKRKRLSLKSREETERTEKMRKRLKSRDEILKVQREKILSRMKFLRALRSS